MHAPGQGSNAFGLRRCSRQNFIAGRLALQLSGPARASAVAAACGLGAGSVSVLAAAVPGPSPGSSPDQHRARVPGSGPLPFGNKRRRMTDVILVLNGVCMMLQWLTRGLLTVWGAKINSYIMAGQLWRLVTPTFLHSGLAHLLVNSYALNALGPELELLGGRKRFLAVYLVSAVTGTAASLFMTPQPSLGSSGSIFGLAAALAVFYWRHQQSLGKTSDRMLRQLGITAAINIGLSILVQNIDNWGHLGGLVGGAVTAWVLGPNMQRNAKGRFVDQPPLRWLAHPEGYMFNLGARSGSKPPSKGKLKAGSLGNDVSSSDVSSSSSSSNIGREAVAGASSEGGVGSSTSSEGSVYIEIGRPSSIEGTGDRESAKKGWSRWGPKLPKRGTAQPGPGQNPD